MAKLGLPTFSPPPTSQGLCLKPLILDDHVVSRKYEKLHPLALGTGCFGSSSHPWTQNYLRFPFCGNWAKGLEQEGRKSGLLWIHSAVYTETLGTTLSLCGLQPIHLQTEGCWEVRG